MPIPDQIQDDAYRGLKREWRFIPYTMISLGLLWFLGAATYLFIYPTMAKSSDVVAVEMRSSAMQVSLKRIEAKNLEKEIIDTISRGCRAPSKVFFTFRVQELRRDYEELTQRSYNIPACSELE